MFYKSLLAAALLFSTPAIAAETSHQCTFKKECIGTDGCADTDYKLTIDKVEGAAALAEGALISTAVTHSLVSDAETIPAYSFRSADKKVVGYWVPKPSGDFQMLTIAENGAARYSIHMPKSELAIYYLGTCAASQ